MVKLRPLKSNAVLLALKKAGFIERRQTGSHLILKNEQSGKITVVPIHGNKDIKIGTLRSIIRQSGVSTEEFFNLLNE